MLNLPFSPVGNNRIPAAAIIAGRMAQTPSPDAVLDGYPEYATGASQLDASQRSALRAAAREIVRSHASRNPIDAVAIVGHSDKALRKAVSERAAFELDISRQRAASARQMLLAEVKELASGAHFSQVLLCVDLGMGNGRPIFQSAATEAQMKRNRRVEIFFFQSLSSQPNCVVR